MIRQFSRAAGHSSSPFPQSTLKTNVVTILSANRETTCFPRIHNLLFSNDPHGHFSLKVISKQSFVLFCFFQLSGSSGHLLFNQAFFLKVHCSLAPNLTTWETKKATWQCDPGPGLDTWLKLDQSESSRHFRTTWMCKGRKLSVSVYCFGLGRSKEWSKLICGTREAKKAYMSVLSAVQLLEKV